MKELGRGLAIEQMVSLAADLKWIETESEIEALILEAGLINKLKPKYNARQKDDKSFLVICITREDFPKVELVRFKNVNLGDKSARYFGPYPAGELLKRSLRYLRRIFPFVDCSKAKFITYHHKERPCLYGDIGLCPGPCADRISAERYRKDIRYLINFLQGRKKEVIVKLEKELKQLSSSKRFEEAAVVRNQLQALNHIKDVAIGIRDDQFNGGEIIFQRIEAYDISNISGQYAVGSMVVGIAGKSDKDEYRRFKIRRGGKSDLEMMREVLSRRFSNDWPKPDLIVIDGGELHLRLAKEVLCGYNQIMPVVAVAKGPKRIKNEFHYGDQSIAHAVAKSAELVRVIICLRDEAHRFARNYFQLVHKKEAFK